jgi:uncharacterized protein (DUF58 family)
MPSSTANPNRLLDPATLARIKPLRLRAQRIVEGYVAGLHRSPYQGFSNEFAEHREYAPGDDLRYVDWKVFGKTDKVYLKQFEEETNLIAYLVLDTSESMNYASEGMPLTKLAYAQSAAAALAYLVLHQQDAVGLATFDREVRRVVRPSSSPLQLGTVLGVLEEMAPVEKTATGPIFHDLAERFARRGLVIVLSDLFDDVAPMIAGLKHFRHRRHDVVVMQVMDPAELDFPFQQATLFKGLEAAGELLVEPARLRKAYQAELESYQIELRTGCRKQGIDYVQLRTDQPLDSVLATYLAQRQQRIK